jgi:hypothetical protein
MLIGIAVVFAYLSVGSRPQVVGAIPARQVLPQAPLASQVGFTDITVDADEDDGTVDVQVQLTGDDPPDDAPIIVELLTAPGTAVPGLDYNVTPNPTQRTFAAPGTQAFQITILRNPAAFPQTRTVNLILRIVSGTATLSPGQAVLAINNVDPTPTPTLRPTAATGTPIFVDLTEPNNTFEEAHQIQPDAAATCQLTLWPPGDQDFYSFAVKSGTFYKILTNQLSPGIDTILKIYNQSGQPIAENDDSGVAGEFQSEVVIQANTTGIYYALVVNKSPADAANKTYCFAVDAMEQPTATPTPTLLPTRAGSDICEPNGRLDLACLFGENQSQAFNFVPPFNEGPDQDYYRIWVKPGTTITCETNELSSVTDTNMIFLGPNGEDFNPQLGNDDKAPGDKGSRLTFTSNYTGFLHVLVGPVNPVPLAQAAQFTYTLACTSTIQPTATPVRPVATVPPGGGGIPIAPTITPLATPTPIDLSALLTPSPVVIPEVTIQPLPTATLPAGAGELATVNVTVYYDSNFNFTPEDNEGIIDIAVALFDNTTGRLLAFGYTNQAGAVRFEAVPSSGAIRVSVPLLNYTQIVGPGESNIAVRVAPLPLPIGIP